MIFLNNIPFPTENSDHDNTDPFFQPAEPLSPLSYLGFSSNGMTDNEKIDDCSYFEEFLTEKTDDDITHS